MHWKMSSRIGLSSSLAAPMKNIDNLRSGAFVITNSTKFGDSQPSGSLIGYLLPGALLQIAAPLWQIGKMYQYALIASAYNAARSKCVEVALQLPEEVTFVTNCLQPDDTVPQEYNCPHSFNSAAWVAAQGIPDTAPSFEGFKGQVQVPTANRTRCR